MVAGGTAGWHDASWRHSWIDGGGLRPDPNANAGEFWFGVVVDAAAAAPGGVILRDSESREENACHGSIIEALVCRSGAFKVDVTMRSVSVFSFACTYVYFFLFFAIALITLLGV